MMPPLTFGRMTVNSYDKMLMTDRARELRAAGRRDRVQRSERHTPWRAARRTPRG